MLIEHLQELAVSIKAMDCCEGRLIEAVKLL